MAHHPYVSSKFHELYPRLSRMYHREQWIWHITLMYHLNSTNSIIERSQTLLYLQTVANCIIQSSGWGESAAHRSYLSSKPHELYHQYVTKSTKQSRTVSYRAADEAHRSYLRSKSHQLYHQYVTKSMIWMSRTPSYSHEMHHPSLPSKSHELHLPKVTRFIIRRTPTASYELHLPNVTNFIFQMSRALSSEGHELHHIGIMRIACVYDRKSHELYYRNATNSMIWMSRTPQYKNEAHRHSLNPEYHQHRFFFERLAAI